MEKTQINKLLLNLYSNPLSNIAFSSVKRLYNAAKNVLPSININDVKHFLQAQDSYTLHKLTKKRFKIYRKIIAARPKVIISMDLIDMVKISSFNDGFKYLIFFIDVYSRKNTIIPIKSKNKIEVLNGLKLFFNLNDNHKYVRMYSDYEGSLYSSLVQEFLNKNKILLYSNSSKERKNSMAEIGLKYIKQKIYKYMTHYSTNRYIDVLQNIVEGVNNTNKYVFKNKFLTPQILHEIKRIDFLKEQFQLMFRINNFPKSKLTHSLKLNQLVRIPTTQRTQNLFFKSFNVVNTEEIF